MDFGKRLENLIAENNLTKAKFAELIGVSSGSVSNYVNGKRFPEVPIIENICKVLNVTPTYIITGETDHDDILIQDLISTFSLLTHENKINAVVAIEGIKKRQDIEQRIKD